MKFVVSSNELTSALQILNKVIPSRAIIPIIENFLIEVEDNKLKVTATDTEITLTSSIDLANSEGEGKFAIEAKRFLEIVKEIPDLPLTFELKPETSNITIKTETGKYNMPVILDIDQFPVPQEINPTNSSSINIDPAILQKAIASTLFAIGEDELRPILNGIYFDFTPDYTTFVSTDSHKLIRYRRYDLVSDVKASFVLPKKPSEILKNLLSKIVDNIEVSFNEVNARFKSSTYTLTCRLLEGNYPNYEEVIPKNNDKSAQVDKQIFFNALKRVSLFSNEASKTINLEFEPSKVTITAEDIDFSISAEELVPCIFNSDKFKISFKSTFLQEILNNLEAKDFTFTFSNKKSPALISPAYSEDSNEEILALVMPVALLDEE